MNMPEEMSATPGFTALMAKLQPLIDGGRLENIVDLLYAAMVEKLAQLFESGTAATWTVSNALRMAKAEVSAQSAAPGTLALLKLLNEEDTRKGVAVVLKTLNVIGRQL